MQQRQLRLGDVLDDYCPRERRLTNHVIVAMVGDEVKHTRCTTCDADHDYKHAKVPRQRKKTDTPAALYAQVAAGAPKRVVHDPGAAAEPSAAGETPPDSPAADMVEESEKTAAAVGADALPSPGEGEGHENAEAPEGPEREEEREEAEEEGPVHRPLIRASLPRTEGQPPPSRPIPEFTIRQPGGRQNRFRPRHQPGGQQFFGNRSGGQNGNTAGGPRHGGPRQGGRPPQGATPSRHQRRNDPGRRRPK